MFYMSSGAVRETNPKCTFKTEIANDRAEPTILVQLGQWGTRGTGDREAREEEE